MMGKPIVTLYIEDMVEEVKEAGGGVFVKKPDYQLFAKEIIELLKDPDRRRKMGQSAREYALQNCTLDVVIKKRVEIINRLLAER